MFEFFLNNLKFMQRESSNLISNREEISKFHHQFHAYDLVIRETNTRHGRENEVYRKEGRGRNTSVLRPAIRTPRPRLGISCCSTAPAN